MRIFPWRAYRGYVSNGRMSNFNSCELSNCGAFMSRCDMANVLQVLGQLVDVGLSRYLYRVIGASFIDSHFTLM